MLKVSIAHGIEKREQSLRRCGFLEIIVRIAKAKFVDNEMFSSIADATENLIEGYILANTYSAMTGQEFRDKEAWNLDMDDLIKANDEGLQALYRHVRVTGHVRGMFDISDARRLPELIGFEEEQII